MLEVFANASPYDPLEDDKPKEDRASNNPSKKLIFDGKDDKGGDDEEKSKPEYYFATQTQDSIDDNDPSDEEESEEDNKEEEKENNNEEGKHKKKDPPQHHPPTPVTAQKRIPGNNNGGITAGTPTAGSPLPPKIFESSSGSIANPYANVRPSTATQQALNDYLSALKTLQAVKEFMTASSTNFDALPATDKGKQQLVQLQHDVEKTKEHYRVCMSTDRTAKEQAKQQRSTQAQLMKNASARSVDQKQASQGGTSSDAIGAKSNNNNVNDQVSTNATPDGMDEISEITRPEERREHSSKTIL